MVTKLNHYNFAKYILVKSKSRTHTALSSRNSKILIRLIIMKKYEVSCCFTCHKSGHRLSNKGSVMAVKNNSQLLHVI